MKMKDLVDVDLLYSSKGKGLAAISVELGQNTCIPYCTYCTYEVGPVEQCDRQPTKLKGLHV